MKHIGQSLRALARALDDAAERIDPQPPIQFGRAQEAEEFRERLAQEAREEMFPPAFRAEIERAMDICYGEAPARPTRFTRKLHAVQGGRR